MRQLQRERLLQDHHVDALAELRPQQRLAQRDAALCAGNRGDKDAFGGNELDFSSLQGRSWDGAQQALTQKEAVILKALAEREGEVVSREELLDKAWGYELYPSTRTVDNFIVRLRKRFERDPQQPQHFHTVRGLGYRFTIQGESS